MASGRSASGSCLFVAFGLFFEGVIGLSGDPFLVGSDYLPIALIGLGGVVLLAGAAPEPPDVAPPVRGRNALRRNQPPRRRGVGSMDERHAR